ESVLRALLWVGEQRSAQRLVFLIVSSAGKRPCERHRRRQSGAHADQPFWGGADEARVAVGNGEHGARRVVPGQSSHDLGEIERCFASHLLAASQNDFVDAELALADAARDRIDQVLPGLWLEASLYLWKRFLGCGARSADVVRRKPGRAAALDDQP